MPVQLDWEFEDAKASLPDAERKTKTGPSGCLRRWRAFALVTLATLVALSLLAIRIRQSKKGIENELRALVELELSTLINGDQDLFLSCQDPDDQPWRRFQETAFERFHQDLNLPPGQDPPYTPQLTAEIPAVYLGEDQARVMVQFADSERVWRELWFYRWTRSNGWRHVRFAPEWLGELRALTTNHVRLTYPQRDEIIAHDLAYEMEDWYDTLAPLFDIKPRSETLLTVQFAYRDPEHPHGLETYRSQDNPFTVLAPSPQQCHLSADDTPSLELRGQIAHHFVEALIARQAGLQPDTVLPVEINALRRELHDWAMTHLASVSLPSQDVDHNQWGTQPTPLLDALVARDGARVIPYLVAALYGSKTLNQALALADVEPPDPSALLAFPLDAEN